MEKDHVQLLLLSCREDHPADVEGVGKGSFSECKQVACFKHFVISLQPALFMLAYAYVCS